MTPSPVPALPEMHFEDDQHDDDEHDDEDEDGDITLTEVNPSLIPKSFETDSGLVVKSRVRFEAERVSC